MKDVNYAIIAETKRRIVEESIPRINQCLGYLDEGEVWITANDNCNSIGVLILHLCGNVRQWILSGACGLPDIRDRNLEFNPAKKPSKDELTAMLNELQVDLLEHLPKIQGLNLLGEVSVQCYNETILSILVHAIEHFSYHTGQIVYLTKHLKDVDTGFYAGQDLTAKG